MLDHLSGGRLELGVGRGVSPTELALYNVSGDDSRDMFRESLDILLMGLSTGKVSYEGRYYNLNEVAVPLRPLQQPYPPLWYPTSSVERVAWIAEQGFSTLFGFTMPTLEQTASEMARFRGLLAEHKDDPGRMNAHVAKPLYGVNRHVYVGESDAAADDVARTAYTEFDDNFKDRPGRTPGDHYSRRGDFETARANGSIIAGSPETVRRRAQELVDATGANYFVGTFAFGNLTTEQLLSSLRRFAEEVMPEMTPAAAPPVA